MTRKPLHQSGLRPIPLDSETTVESMTRWRIRLNPRPYLMVCPGQVAGPVPAIAQLPCSPLIATLPPQTETGHQLIKSAARLPVWPTSLAVKRIKIRMRTTNPPNCTLIEDNRTKPIDKRIKPRNNGSFMHPRFHAAIQQPGRCNYGATNRLPCTSIVGRIRPAHQNTYSRTARDMCFLASRMLLRNPNQSARKMQACIWPIEIYCTFESLAGRSDEIAQFRTTEPECAHIPRPSSADSEKVRQRKEAGVRNYLTSSCSETATGSGRGTSESGGHDSQLRSSLTLMTMFLGDLDREATPKNGLPKRFANETRSVSRIHAGPKATQPTKLMTLLRVEPSFSLNNPIADGILGWPELCVLWCPPASPGKLRR
jgi:hypothetical protein